MVARIPAFAEIWTRPEEWPFDTPEAVFFGNALNMIGTAVFEAWEGVEFGLLPFSPVDLAQATGQFIASAAAGLQDSKGALFRADPGAAVLYEALVDAQLRFQAADKLFKITSVRPHHVVGRRGASSSGLRGVDVPDPGLALSTETANVRAAAAAFEARYRAAASLLADAEGPYAERAGAVRRLVVPALIAGKIEALYRWEGDGQLRSCPPNWWNAEHNYVGRRFLTCKIDPRNPTRLSAAPTPSIEPCWLYVERRGLDGFIETLRRSAGVGTPTGEMAALRQLLSMCKDHYDEQTGPVPVGAAWREAAAERFDLGPTAAKRVWAKAVEKYPGLSSTVGKPKRLKPGR